MLELDEGCANAVPGLASARQTHARRPLAYLVQNQRTAGADQHVFFDIDTLAFASTLLPRSSLTVA